MSIATKSEGKKSGKIEKPEKPFQSKQGIQPKWD